MARLLTNLQGEDAIEDAARYGFDFPTESSEDLRRAMDALLEQSEDEPEAAEEVLYDWDDNYQEVVEIDSCLL